MKKERKRKKILVVDDERPIQMLLEDELTNDQCEVICCNNGLEALWQIHNSNKPDLVITDIRMPQMDGIELTKQIKTEIPDLPVVILTGLASPPKNHPADRIIEKSPILDELHAVVNQFFNTAL